MTVRRYEYYPAAPESVRAAAGRVRVGSSNLHTLSQQVERPHRAALDVTHGQLFGPMSQGLAGPYALTSAVCRRAIWAAAQLEVLADAIEVYNTDSSDPWSIEKLNQVADAGVAMYFCVKIPEPHASAEERYAFSQRINALEPEFQSVLDAHHRRLEANLDEAAAAAAQALRTEPSDADIVAMWKAGNLPAHAAATWPHLDLRTIPVDGVSAGLLDLTEQQIIDWLRDPAKALSDAELEWLAVNNPELMQRLHEEWTLEDTVLLPPGESPAGHGPSKHGWILGPDGRWYPVQIPKLPDYDEPTLTAPPGDLFSGSGDWVTLDSRQGPIYIGAGPPTGLLILSSALGYTPQVYGNPSIGENQTDYLTYDRDGNVYEHQQAPHRPPAWGSVPPSSVPEPELDSAPPGTWDPTTMENPRLERFERGSAIADIAIGGLKGLQLSNQIDANSSYAGNVVFQVSGDDRRAVIQLAQIKNDEETGEPVLFRSYASALDVNQERSGDPEPPKLRPDLEEPAPEPGPSPTPPR